MTELHPITNEEGFLTELGGSISSLGSVEKVTEENMTPEKLKKIIAEFWGVSEDTVDSYTLAPHDKTKPDWCFRLEDKVPFSDFEIYLLIHNGEFRATLQHTENINVSISLRIWEMDMLKNEVSLKVYLEQLKAKIHNLLLGGEYQEC